MKEGKKEWMKEWMNSQGPQAQIYIFFFQKRDLHSLYQSTKTRPTIHPSIHPSIHLISVLENKERGGTTVSKAKQGKARQGKQDKMSISYYTSSKKKHTTLPYHVSHRFTSKQASKCTPDPKACVDPSNLRYSERQPAWLEKPLVHIS